MAGNDPGVSVVHDQHITDAGACTDDRDSRIGREFGHFSCLPARHIAMFPGELEDVE